MSQAPDKVSFGRPSKRRPVTSLQLEDDAAEVPDEIRCLKSAPEEASEETSFAKGPAHQPQHPAPAFVDEGVLDKRMLLSVISNVKREGSRSDLSWSLFKCLEDMPRSVFDRLRSQYRILTEGKDIPPALINFEDMRLPAALVRYLKTERKISEPSLIQMQGIPAALAGRDIVGIASTGSGKTLAFCLPLIVAALESEMRLPLLPGEGPVSMILAPSRELARQTFDQCIDIAAYLAANGLPRLKIVSLIGGLPLADQIAELQRGAHVIVGTPGRTLDILKKDKLFLYSCRHICLDEADRMIDLGFEEDLRGILEHVRQPYVQMLLFSATMPNSIREFAKNALCDPVLINVGRAGAANLDIVQEVELVDYTRRLASLLSALQKTAPPVIIFAAGKGDVDDILEYLLLRGIEAVAIHGGKTQEERLYAIDSFKTGKKDVLVATDIASKGLDLQNIQQVINYDMPTEIEDYVHRIGRTGRGGRTGIATTLLDPSACSEAVLLDLKHLLNEAKQYIPTFLAELKEAQSRSQPCSVCGGLGHDIDKCPKVGVMASKQLSTLRSAGSYSEL